MTLDQILAYMRSDGWPLERLSESTFHSSFQGQDRPFSFFLNVDSGFLTLLAVPYVRLPPNEQQAESLMQRLLQLNREMNLAKFSVDDDGDVVLSVEYRVAELSPSKLKDALNALSFYADKHWQEISILAHAWP